MSHAPRPPKRPALDAFPVTCTRCGRTHTEQAWDELRFDGVIRAEGWVTEMRRCPCGGTMGVEWEEARANPARARRNPAGEPARYTVKRGRRRGAPSGRGGLRRYVSSETHTLVVPRGRRGRWLNAEVFELKIEDDVEPWMPPRAVYAVRVRDREDPSVQATYASIGYLLPDGEISFRGVTEERFVGGRELDRLIELRGQQLPALQGGRYYAVVL